MNKTDQDLREKALSKFFREERFEPREIHQLMIELADYVTINRNGEVFIENEELTDEHKLALVVAARFLANKEEPSIEETISLKEAAKYARVDEKVTSARLSELVKKGILDRTAKGIYKIRSLSAIRKLLKELKEYE